MAYIGVAGCNNDSSQQSTQNRQTNANVTNDMSQNSVQIKKEKNDLSERNLNPSSFVKN